MGTSCLRASRSLRPLHVRTTEIAFAGGSSDLPVWFRMWVDASGLVHRAEMRAPGHFMDHRYFDYDAPITIEPPEGASG